MVSAAHLARAARIRGTQQVGRVRRAHRRVDGHTPDRQARIAYTAANKACIGISGHWGTDADSVILPGIVTKNYQTLSTNLDVLVPLGEKMKVKAEYWNGKDLDAFLGGIGQGLNATDDTEIRSQGG